MRQVLALMAVAASLIAIVREAPAAARGGPECCAPATGGNSGQCEAPAMVERTIYVPQLVTQKRKMMVTKYREEQQTRTLTTYKMEPETRAVTRTYTAMVPETRTREVTRTVCVPVWKDEERQVTVMVREWQEVEKQVTVMVPTQEQRSGTRKVWKTTPVTETRRVTRDQGHWEDRQMEVAAGGGCDSGRCHHRGLFRRARCGECASACGGCGGCGGCGDSDGCAAPATQMVTRRVWVPNLVTEDVQVTVNKCQLVEEPFSHTVTVCKPEVRTRKMKVLTCRPETRTQVVKVCHKEMQQKTFKVTETVCVPTQKTKTYNVTVCKRVPVELTRTCTVRVPYQVEEERDVCVRQMVPKTIMVPAGSCDNGGCGGRHGLFRRGCSSCGGC